MALPKNHPLISKQSIYIRDLADEIFIITPELAGTLYYESFMSVFDDVDFMPKIMIQAHDLQTVLTLVGGRDGYHINAITLYTDSWNRHARG